MTEANFTVSVLKGKENKYQWLVVDFLIENSHE